ncbi:MAG: hypothetical protein JW845_07740 [Dehalococcoidales bacterium]|nr:hypothetical protein [Dehalococcoidales bacterium]
MLLLDGVKYEEWIPTNEAEFENMVKEHTQEIFGEKSVYLDIKPYLKSVAGIGSIPDGICFIYGENPQWYIVEAELSSHSVHEHIVPQVARFTTGIKSPTTQRKITELIYNEILKNEVLTLNLRKAVMPTEIYKFVSDLVSTKPILAIIIDKETPELEDIKITLAHLQIKVVEFKTYIREGIKSIHAHIFESLYKQTVAQPTAVKEPKTTKPLFISDDQIIITIQNNSFIKFHLFVLYKDQRKFFPGFKIPFELVTDIGTVESWVTSASAGTQKGDPDAGRYIQANLANWYRKHPTIKIGDQVIFRCIEPMKKYRLEIVK